MKKGLFIGLVLSLLLTAAIFITAYAASGHEGVSWQRYGTCHRTTVLYDITTSTVNYTWDPHYTSGYREGEYLVNGHQYALNDGCRYITFYYYNGNEIKKSWNCSDPCE
jgi:hypothetical protein